MSYYVPSYDDVDRKLQYIVEKFDTYIVQLENRLSKPDKGLFGASGSPDANCLKGLTYLNNAVAVRNIIFGSMGAPMTYKPTPDTNKAATKLGALFAAPGVSLDEAPKISLPPGIATRDDVKLVAFALAAINALAASPVCQSHSRIENFSKNTASTPGMGLLGIEEFKGKADAWLKTKGYDIMEINEHMERYAAQAKLTAMNSASNAQRLASLGGRLNSLSGKAGANTFGFGSAAAAATAQATRLSALQKKLGEAPGGTGYDGRGGARRNRKTRRNRKVRRTTKTKSRKNNKSRRHQ